MCIRDRYRQVNKYPSPQDCAIFLLAWALHGASIDRDRPGDHRRAQPPEALVDHVRQLVDAS
eukprot:8813487-Lingulodinium_polyedra.AAC.1